MYRRWLPKSSKTKVGIDSGHRVAFAKFGQFAKTNFHKEYPTLASSIILRRNKAYRSLMFSSILPVFQETDAIYQK